MFLFPLLCSHHPANLRIVDVHGSCQSNSLRAMKITTICLLLLHHRQDQNLRLTKIVDQPFGML